MGLLGRGSHLGGRVALGVEENPFEQVSRPFQLAVMCIIDSLAVLLLQHLQRAGGVFDAQVLFLLRRHAAR